MCCLLDSQGTKSRRYLITHSICDNLLQALSEGPGGDFSMKLNAKVLGEGLCQRQSIKLDIGVAVSEALQQSGDDIARPWLQLVDEGVDLGSAYPSSPSS